MCCRLLFDEYTRASTVPKAFIEPNPCVFGTLLGAEGDPLSGAQDKDVAFHAKFIDVAFVVGNLVGYPGVIVFKYHDAKD